MADLIEITSYDYGAHSSQGTGGSTWFIRLWSASGFLGSALFMKDATLLGAGKYVGGYVLYYDNGDLPWVVDMLRNEKPVYLSYDRGNAWLKTTQEPIGEGEI